MEKAQQDFSNKDTEQADVLQLQRVLVNQGHFKQIKYIAKTKPEDNEHRVFAA